MRVGFGVIVLGAAMVACGSSDDAADPSSEPDPTQDDTTSEGEEGVTYHRDVRPIIEANCVGCHTEGGTGPFPLDSLESVTDVRELVVGAVADRYMPPWPADADCHDLRDVLALPDEQVQLIEDWASADYPTGDEASYVSPQETAILDLGEPSHVLLPVEGYVPDVSVADEYRCFLTEGVFEDDVYVTAMDIRPGVRQQVHHVQVHKIDAALIPDVHALEDAAPGAGYPCGGAGVPSVNMFSYRPGSAAVTFEDGDAARVEGGSAIVLQVHYNNQFLEPGTTPLEDRSGVALWTLPAGELPERVVVRYSHFGPVGTPSAENPTGVVRAGEVDTGILPVPMTSISSVNGQYIQGEIIGMTPHMHSFGTRLTETLVRSDGAEECMVNVPDWDFEWQLDYSFDSPVTYSQDDVLRVECEYDNTAANQPFLNGERITPADIRWGEGSLDEMCLNYVWLRYPRDAFMTALTGSAL